MPCFHPLHAYNKIGGGITWKKSESNGTNATVPCGQCTGCRQEYSRQWAMRNMHEASLWLNNIFITLTYDNDHLPQHNTLIKKDFQDFMKRLRKKKKRKHKQSNKILSMRRIRRKIRPSALSCNTIQHKFSRPRNHTRP